MIVAAEKGMWILVINDFHKPESPKLFAKLLELRFDILELEYLEHETSGKAYHKAMKLRFRTPHGHLSNAISSIEDAIQCLEHGVLVELSYRV